MLTRDSNEGYLKSLMEILAENGIPANIQGTETARMLTRRVVFEPSLWVYLNEQFEDAVNLINDPNYKVTTGIDIEDFYAQQPSEEEQNTAAFNFIVNASAYALVAIFAVFLFIHFIEGA